MLGCAEAWTLESATPPSTGRRTAVCLGCGCACDDIRLVIRDGLIANAQHVCELGAAWFGNGIVPGRIRVGGTDASLEQAVSVAADLLTAARDPLVLLAPDLTCESQRHGVAIADRLRASLDSVTSAAMPWLLAGQEVGRATATLGEIRHRADTIVFWATDTASAYPRFAERYLSDADALHLGGKARRLVAVDVGEHRGPAEADLRVTLDPDAEGDALTLLAAAVESASPAGGSTALPHAVNILLQAVHGAAYVAVVADCEDPSGRVQGRPRGVLRLAHALNGPSRCAALLLRSGGNRSGADAVLTSQTGYPSAVDFALGYPRYRPFDGTADARLARGDIDAALVLGSASQLPRAIATGVSQRTSVVVGPRASEGPLGSSRVVIDTGIAGIHDGGTALRMDDVPLPLRAAIDGPPSAGDVLTALRARLGVRYREVS